eukprot:1137333-Pelagomonas_calceolata.AAC.20
MLSCFALERAAPDTLPPVLAPSLLCWLRITVVRASPAPGFCTSTPKARDSTYRGEQHCRSAEVLAERAGRQLPGLRFQPDTSVISSAIFSPQLHPRREQQGSLSKTF